VSARNILTIQRLSSTSIFHKSLTISFTCLSNFLFQKYVLDQIFFYLLQQFQIYFRPIVFFLDLGALITLSGTILHILLFLNNIFKIFILYKIPPTLADPLDPNFIACTFLFIFTFSYWNSLHTFTQTTLSNSPK
jgi:hypothetical protein